MSFDSAELALVIVETERDGEGHVGARAEARQSNLVLIDAELVGVVGHVKDSVYSILDGGRKRVLGSQTVVDRDDDSSAFIDDGSTPAGVVAGAAQGEASAVEVDDTRVLFLCKLCPPVLFVILGHVEVQLKVAGHVTDGGLDGALE
jgi:hypothetical protein